MSHLQQRVGAWKYEEDDPIPEGSEGESREGTSSASEDADADDSTSDAQAESSRRQADSESLSGSELDAAAPAAFQEISFGSLASAQAALSGNRRRASSESGSRARRRSPSPFREAAEREAGHSLRLQSVKSRPSKHAPVEQSSKKAVSRRRTVLTDPRQEARDPRFSSLSGRVDLQRVEHQYGFLKEYRAAERTELKTRARQSKDAKQRAVLERQLTSMEDQERARARKAQEQAIETAHRREERLKVSQGKQPYFLKKGAVKQQALAQKFESLGARKRSKLLERKRKKQAARERQEMPRTRRGAG